MSVRMNTQLCLDFINAVVCYSSLPVQSLHDLVTMLCLSLNVEKFAKKSLDVSLISHSLILKVSTQTQKLIPSRALFKHCFSFPDDAEITGHLFGTKCHVYHVQHSAG